MAAANSMQKPPDAFIEEYWKMRERVGWAMSAAGRGQDLAQAKTVVDECEDFYARWHDVITIPELRAGLEALHQLVAEGIGATLEQSWLEQLHAVIEARKDCLAGEVLLKWDIQFIEIMKLAEGAMRAELEKIYREHMKKEYDPEGCYRDGEEGAAENEADFRKLLATLEADWPERVDAALRARLEGLDAEAANAWQAEIEEQQSEPALS